MAAALATFIAIVGMWYFKEDPLDQDRLPFYDVVLKVSTYMHTHTHILTHSPSS